MDSHDSERTRIKFWNLSQAPGPARTCDAQYGTSFSDVGGKVELKAQIPTAN
jgi:hypothetical protein